MALSGKISAEQLTTFVLYVEFVTAASLSVCDQWGKQRPLCSGTLLLRLSIHFLEGLSAVHASRSPYGALW